MLKTFHIWQTKTGSTLIEAGRVLPQFLMDDMEKIIHTFTASSYTESMQKYHAYMGFGEYRPMMDEEGQPYPEDSEEYV